MAIAIDIDKEKLRAFCDKWKVTEFSLFGSVTRPEAFRDDSDVDVLVRFADDAEWSLFDHMDMEDELKTIFRRRVDLVSRRAVDENDNHFIRRGILGGAVPLELL
jgi:predicted nucleotidyltransferase